MKSLSLISCGTVTRALRSVRNLKGKAYVVGGLISEGATLRDIDIVVTVESDIKILKDALGKLSSRVHFLLQKNGPGATMYVVITGKEPTNVDYIKPKKGENVPKYEYATPPK